MSEAFTLAVAEALTERAANLENPISMYRMGYSGTIGGRQEYVRCLKCAIAFNSLGKKDLYDRPKRYELFSPKLFAVYLQRGVLELRCGKCGLTLEKALAQESSK